MNIQLEKDIKEQIKKPLRTAGLLLGIGIPFCLLMPFILTSVGIIDFTETGQIGDTIGGITAPFVGLLGSILVFLALKSQIDANLNLQEQLERQDNEKKIENESKQIHQLYNNLKGIIDNFRYTTLEGWQASRIQQQVFYGSEGIYKLFQDLYCNSHYSDEALKCNPKIAEIISMLEICDALLNRVIDSEIAEKETIKTLTAHQFLYRIFPRIRPEFPNNIEQYYCENCKEMHGLPSRIGELFKSIVAKVATEFEIQAC